ncbi:MAG: efflux RND transporter permease subunit [Phycisphaerae bacterium]
MIAGIIEACVRNRMLVVILSLFVVFGGVWAIYNIRLDAIPDLSDVQVIVFAEYPGQAPQVVEDQVTYPLATAMLAVPYAKVVRGYSFFGFSFVYIIFEDGTDLYWARSRVLEYLNYVSGRLPQAVTPQLGPDATGVGWVYQYSLRNGYYCPQHPQGLYHDSQTGQWYADPSEAPRERRKHLEHVRVWSQPGRCPLDGRTELKLGQYDLSELRTLQDWYLRYELTAVEGVAEVASVGGFVRQYQVVVDPDRLLAYGIPLGRIRTAIQRSNNDVGGRVLEMSETEYMVRGLGYVGAISQAQIEQARQAGVPLWRARAEQGLQDLRQIAVGASPDGTPIWLADVADVHLGPEIRRGLAEADGRGEVVGGIVVIRFGENALKVIRAVKAKLAELKLGLPPGVDVVSEYDRSGLIERAVATLKEKLLEEMIVVAIVCVVFLLHFRSAFVAVFVLPTGVLASLILMNTGVFGLFAPINANIMSLGGIAIAIGVMVDSSVVMVENAHKHLERERGAKSHEQIIIDAAREVGPALFYSLIIITVSFLPVFALGEQSGRLFKPLAYTKTFAMAASSVLAVTIIPVLMYFLVRPRAGLEQRGRVGRAIYAISEPMLRVTRRLAWLWLLLGACAAVGLASQGTWWGYLLAVLVVAWALYLAFGGDILPEARSPLSRFFIWIYLPVIRLVLRHRWATVAAAVAVVVISLYPLQERLLGRTVVTIPGIGQLGSEFMPPLNEGDLLYMPTTDPGISITKARELLQQTDKLIKTFPEVHHVFGKIGRAETATDPAPLSMIETTIMLEPDQTKWRKRRFKRWFSFLPEAIKTYSGLSYFWPEERPITIEELTYGYTDLDGRRVPGLNEVVNFPGLTNAWTMPIKTRIDMLSTGIKTPVGIKIMGDDLAVLSDLAERIAGEVRTLPGTLSAYPEKTVGGNYVDFEIDRAEIARYGLTVGDVQDVILSALGGTNVTWTVEGLERYPVNLRYKRELRDNLPALRRTLVHTPIGAQVPIAQLAQIRVRKGPPSIKSENARKTAWIYVDLTTSDVGGWVERAKRLVSQRVTLPAGYSIVWSGQYEYMQAAARRLKLVVPVTIVVIFLLLYFHFRNLSESLIVMASLPFALVGGIWLMTLLGYNLSVAVYVGFIALAGLAAETGVVMLVYLDGAYRRRVEDGQMTSRADIDAAVIAGSVERVRPVLMTVGTTLIGLLPVMLGAGAGSQAMKRIAAPMVGGLISSTVLTLVVIPAVYGLLKQWQLRRVARGS